MIVQVTGTLISKELDRVEVMTAGGVAYTVAIPLSAYEALPRLSESVTLHTHLVVKEDAWQLFGFCGPFERKVFERLLSAKGVGPALALAMLSTLTAERLLRAIREHDIATLQSVPRVGRKKAEQLVLDLADKLDDLGSAGAMGGRMAGAGADDAVRALVSLGYAPADAERAIRATLDEGGRGLTATELIRSALARVAAR